MQDLAGDAARHVGNEEHGGLADLLDRHGAAQRRVVLVPAQDVAEIADAGGGERLDRTGRDRVDANLRGAEIGGEILHARLQRSLRHAHDVVMRHPLLGAVIGQRQHGAAIGHQLLGALGDGGEGVAGDQQRLGEVRFGRLDIAARQLVLVGEGDAVDDEVELAPELLDLGEDGVDRGGIGDVAMADDMAAQLLGERLDALLQGVALIGEGELGTASAAALAMPQAIERLLATPMTRPRLPLRRLAVGRARAFDSGMGDPRTGKDEGAS